MSIKQRLEQYFSLRLPADRQVFRVALVLGVLEFFVAALFAVILRMDIRVPVLIVVGGAVSVAALYVEYKTNDLNLISVLYLFLVHTILIPVIFHFVSNPVYDFPVYMITGIAYAVILLRGRVAVAFILVELILDMVYLYRMADETQGLLRLTEGAGIYGPVLYCRIMLALFLTGSVCGILVSYRNRILRYEMEENARLEQQAEQVNYAKDMFLVNVSHEIRTPLNAILGTAELLLDLDTEEGVKGNAFQIANSSKALLSITNNLMDFSKMDYGSLKVVDTPYYIGDILGDLINMFSVQLSERKIELFVDIAVDIPAELSGDGAMLKQVTLNLLAGVVKSMEKGVIFLTVQKEDMAESNILLSVEVKAQGSFVSSFKEQMYSGRSAQDKEEENIPMTVRMVQTLGGRLSINEKERSRNYYFSIPQQIVSNRRIIDEHTDKPNILFYENTSLEQNMLADALSKMGIPFWRASTSEELYEECVKECYTHVMVAAERYEGLKERLQELMKPQTLILIGFGVAAYGDALVETAVTRPVNILNLDALLGGKNNFAVRHVGYRGKFVCPDARIMVVDDNIINLEVATGMLKRYRAQVLVATNGKECINTLRQEEIDLIFLDYMMPEMDGIDTLKNIKAMDKEGISQIPIIALTANAVSGAREMFMEAGFDEYISKPIEMDKFERVLRDCLPKDKIVYMANEEAAYDV